MIQAPKELLDIIDTGDYRTIDRAKLIELAIGMYTYSIQLELTLDAAAAFIEASAKDGGWPEAEMEYQHFKNRYHTLEYGNE